MSDKERLLEYIEQALDRINKIDILCVEFGDIKQALQDELLAQPAIMKHIDVLYETFIKIKNCNIANNIYNMALNDYVDIIREIRILSSHDYNSLELDKVEDIIVKNLFQFKIGLQDILNNFDNLKVNTNSAIDKLENQIRKNEQKIETYQRKNNEMKKELDELRDNELKEEAEQSTSKPTRRRL